MHKFYALLGLIQSCISSSEKEGFENSVSIDLFTLFCEYQLKTNPEFDVQYKGNERLKEVNFDIISDSNLFYVGFLPKAEFDVDNLHVVFKFTGKDTSLVNVYSSQVTLYSIGNQTTGWWHHHEVKYAQEIIIYGKDIPFNKVDGFPISIVDLSNSSINGRPDKSLYGEMILRW